MIAEIILLICLLTLGAAIGLGVVVALLSIMDEEL